MYDMPGRMSIGSLSVRVTFERMSRQGAAGPPLLVDVREAWEYQAGHAPAAISLPLSELRARHGEIPRERDIFLICHLGERSMVAARFLSGMGYTHLFNVEGGMDAWEAAGLPVR